jgi:hypothetical protein
VNFKNAGYLQQLNPIIDKNSTRFLNFWKNLIHVDDLERKIMVLSLLSFLPSQREEWWEELWWGEW